MAEIVLNRVSKQYPGAGRGSGPNAVVNDVSLTCPDGAFVVLVGPSGCGKSTTLRMVAGLEEITDGTISIGGRVVNDVQPKDRDIAMVFQNYALYPHMSVYQNMAFALKLRRLPREQIDRRVRAAAETLGLTELLDRKPAALSGGQRQRVAVGRAIVREPKAFLFDEPLSNLDAKLRVSTRAELKGLHQRLKTTTLYVTHDQEEAMTLADIVVVMSNGKVQQVGPPLVVYAHPANRFVAAFLGTPPMNFVEGTICVEGQSVVLEEGSNDPSGKPRRIVLDGRLAVAAKPYAGKPLVLGIRPQAMRVAGNAHTSHATITGPAWPTLTLPVRVVEPLGDQMDVFCSTERHPQLVARIETDAMLKPGAVVAFALDPSRLHLFEPGEFGRSVIAR
jgi:multiple sugar transport system ATP-binding protein